MENAIQPYDGLQASFRQMLSTIPASKGKQFLKLGQHEHPTPGHFVFGVDNIVMSPDAQWILDPHTIEHGFLLRKGKAPAPLDDVKVPISEFLPGTPGGIVLPPNRGGIWSHAYSGVFVSVDDPALIVEFSGDTTGIRRFYKKIVIMLEAHMSTNHQGAIFPILSLSSSSYNAYGKPIFNPEFEVLAFATAEQIKDFVETAQDNVEVQEQAINAAAAPGSAPTQPLYTPPPAYAAAPQTVTDGSGVRHAIVPPAETVAPQPGYSVPPPVYAPPQPFAGQPVSEQPFAGQPVSAQPTVAPQGWQPPTIQPAAPAPAPIPAPPVGAVGQPPAPVAAAPPAGVPGQPPAPIPLAPAAAPPAVAPIAAAPAAPAEGKKKKGSLRRQRRVATS